MPLLDAVQSPPPYHVDATAIATVLIVVVVLMVLVIRGRVGASFRVGLRVGARVWVVGAAA
jgi:hypothetical protein